MTAATEVHAGARLQSILEGLAWRVDGLRAAVVGDPNGLPVASLARGETSLAATAMATMILYAAENVASNLGLAGHKDVLIEGGGWKVLVRSLGGGFTLLGVLDGTVNLGLVRLEIERSTPEMRALLDELA